jgi:hypothetical protein
MIKNAELRAKTYSTLDCESITFDSIEMLVNGPLAEISKVFTWHQLY